MEATKFKLSGPNFRVCQLVCQLQTQIWRGSQFPNKRLQEPSKQKAVLLNFQYMKMENRPILQQ